MAVMHLILKPMKVIIALPEISIKVIIGKLTFLTSGGIFGNSTFALYSPMMYANLP